MRTIVILLIAVLFMVSCKSESSKDLRNSTQVMIKGSFLTTRSATSDASSATQVVLFNSDGDFTTSPVTNGSFAIRIGKDDPVGLIFTNGNKAFLGYLTLGQGVESLPLNYLNDTVSVVDLGPLTSNAKTVVSDNDILNQKLQMTSSQIKAYGQASINFSSVIKNPDVDKNGIIDILENKFYHIAFLYFGNGTNFSTTPAQSTITPTSYRIMFITKDSNTPDAVTFSSLDGTASIGTNQKKVVSNQTIYFSELLSLSSPQFSSCKIQYKDQTLYFDIPDQTGTLTNAVNVFPKFHYDGANKMNKITWEYYSGNTNTIIDASRIILKVMAQVSGADYSNRIYDSPNYDPEVKQDILASPIELSKIGVINMAYYDIFGNNVVVSYPKQ